MIGRALPFAINGLRVLLADRGLLFVDFFIATSVAFAMQFLIWTNVYGDNQEIAGFNLTELLFYCGFTIFFVRLNNTYDLIEGISHDVAEGKIEVHMAKPVGFVTQRFFAYAGGGLLYLWPIVVLTMVLWIVAPPFHDLGAAHAIVYVGLALLSIALSVALSFCVGMLLGLWTFWLVRDDFILAFLTTFTSFLGGAIVPAAFWPSYIQPLMTYNPFQYFIAAPAKLIVTGNLREGVATVFFLILYTSCAAAAIVYLWPRVLRKYAGAGG